MLVLGVVACKATLGLEASATIAGQQAQVKISYDGRDVNAERLPANERTDVKFFDAKGKSLEPGATGVGQGQKVPVPQGASYCEVSGASGATSCTGCTPPAGGGGGGGMAERHEQPDAIAVAGSGPQGLSKHVPVPVLAKWVYVFTLDADIDGRSVWGNVSGSFTLQGNPDAAQIHQQIEAILLGGHGTPVPSGVNVDTFVRILPEALGGRMFIADKTAAFTAMTMSWNDNAYATLGGGNTSMYAAPNGWQVIEILIPLKDFNITASGGSANHMDLSWTTVEDVRANEMHQGIIYF